MPVAFTCLSMISEHLQPGTDYDVAVAMLESLESTYGRTILPAAIDHLLQLPYWNRAWIFQELILSTRLVFFYADNEFVPEHLEKIQKCVQRPECAFKRRPLPASLVSDIRKVVMFDMMRSVRNFRDVKTREKENGDVEQAKAHKLLQKLRVCRGRWLEATNPKDHIYPILGVTGLNLEPRYGDETYVA